MDLNRKLLLSPENELAVQLCMRMFRCGPRYERGPGLQMYQQVVNTTASVLLKHDTTDIAPRFAP